MKPWFVYLVECTDGTLYTGTTNDIDRRMKAHANGTGSKYVRAKGFSHLIASRKYQTRSEACKVEALLKKLSPQEKHKWLTTQ